MEYEIIAAMYLKHEYKGFTIDRPNGTDRYVFIHFTNPVDIRTHNQMLTTMPHACIIYSPNAPCYYAANTFEMFHDWVCFTPLEEEYNPLNLGLPINKIFYTDIGIKVTKMMETISWLHYKRRMEDKSSELLKLFKLLSEERRLTRKNKIYSERTDIFNELRLLVYETPKNWNITSMAAYVNLSRSRFSVKYKSIFGVSPIDDLSNASMCLAKKLLSTTSLTCQNIATECGYESTSFFIQKFKTLVGCTPNEWRKSINAN